MKDPEGMELKREVHACSVGALEKRVASLKESLDNAQEAANNETKSSAGDKHETGRAMMQLETEKLASQLANARHDLQRLMRLNPESSHQVISEGAFVRTDKMSLYFSVPAGSFETAGVTVFTLSMNSGLGVAGRGKKAGESFSFRDQTHHILEVW